MSSSPPPPFDRALGIALAAASDAGRILLDDFHRNGGARGKGDKAEADLEAEHAIRERLLAATTGFGYLGEETGRVAGADGAPVWLVDPNDGTRDYLAGRRGSTVSIALVTAGRPVLGVVFAFGYPDDAGDLFEWAEGGGPVRRNGRAVEVRPPDALGALDVVLVSSKGDRDPEANLRCSAPARYRSVPSIAHRLALVAAGEAAAATSLFAPGAWDYAAGHALLRGAGGVLVDEEGREIGYAEDGASRAARAYAGSRAVAEELARRPWQKPSRGPSSGVRARLQPGTAVRDAGVLSRAQGCVLGQLAAGGFGWRADSGDRPALDSSAVRLEDRDAFLAGQPTPEAETVLALARSIVAKGAYDPIAAREAYAERDRSANTPPAPADEAAAALLRATALGLAFHAAPASTAAWLAHEDAGLRCGDADTGDAAAAVAVAVRHAVVHGADARTCWRAAVDWARGADAAAGVHSALEAAADGPGSGRREQAVLALLQDGFHHWLRAPDMASGVLAAVQAAHPRSRHAAALVGALCGVLRGRGGVPDQWRQAVLSCRPHPLRTSRPRPEAYWPIDALELAERLLLTTATPRP
jgi:fructose-1,6-bisphosphatase/inositol monophosphatase family enzyme